MAKLFGRGVAGLSSGTQIKLAELRTRNEHASTCNKTVTTVTIIIIISSSSGRMAHSLSWLSNGLIETVRFLCSQAQGASFKARRILIAVMDQIASLPSQSNNSAGMLS